MKQLILLTLCYLPLSILGQQPLKNNPSVPADTVNHCARMIRQGDEYFKKNLFEKAINAYIAAQACNRDRTAEVSEKITRAFIEINQQKEKALKAERQARKAANAAIADKNEAIRQKEYAENSERIANEALKKVESEKKQVESEKKVAETGQKMSEWSVFAAVQSTTNPNHAWYFAEKGCEESHYTNPLAVSQRAQLWADIDKLYYKQSFFHPLSISVTALTISPKDRFLLAAFADGSVRIWSIETGQLHNEYPKFDQSIKDIAVSDSGTIALNTDNIQQGTIGRPFINPYILKGLNTPFSEVAVSVHSNIFFTGDENGIIRHWVLSHNAQQVDVKAYHKSTDIQYVFCNEKDGSFATIDRYNVVFWDSSGVFLDKWQRNDKEIISASYDKEAHELWILQEDSTLTTLDALRHQKTAERTITLSKNAVLSPDGKKVFVALPDSFSILFLGNGAGFKVANTQTMAWVNKDYLYAITNDKMAVSLIPINDHSKIKIFSIPDNRPICADVSPNARLVLAGEEEDGWLYLYKADDNKFTDAVKTESGVKKIEFIDNQHFMTLHVDGKARLYGIVEEGNNHLRISEPLQTLEKSSGIWGYDATRHRLVSSESDYLMMYPIAAMGEKPTAMDSIWWHEKLAYSLPINEFEVMEKYKKSPDAHRQELLSLAMMQRKLSMDDRYARKSVHLIAAIRYAKAAKDNAFSQALVEELDSVEAKWKSRVYENNLLFSNCLQNLKHFKNDALELDTLYYRYDPAPIYRAEASDRYSSAAYMAILTGAPSDAIQFAKKAMQIDSSKTWAVTNLALGYLYAGQKDAAYQIYTEFNNKYWKNSGYPRVRPSDTMRFKEIFLAHIYDLTENYYKKDTVAFAHLKKVNFEDIKMFLNNGEPVSLAAIDKFPEPKMAYSKKEETEPDEPRVAPKPIVQSKSVFNESKENIEPETNEKASNKGIVLNESKRNAKPDESSKPANRQLTREEKYLLKKIKNGERSEELVKSAANLMARLEKDYALDTTNNEIRSALAEGYFYKAWHNLFIKDFKESELSIKRSLFFDDQQYSAYAVLAHAQLLQGKEAEAQKNYTFYLEHSKNGADEIESDFLLFKNSNIFHKDMYIIEQMIAERRFKKE